MKILFTADLHLNLVKKNVPKEWQRSRYLKLFEELHSISSELDMAILGGDIFDKKPNTEEIELFFELIKGFKVPTFIYDGNHEATKKGETFLHHLKTATELVNNNVHILTGPYEINNMDFIPYTHIKDFNPNEFHNDILFTHVRGNIPPHVQEEIDLTKLSGWDLVVAGDLHSYSNSQTGGPPGMEYRILYPGSPLTISFHRNKVSTGVIVLDSSTLEHEWIELQLPQLLRRTIEKPEQMVKTTYDHTIYELVGSVSDLSNMKLDDSILDKKIIDKNYESTLNLHNLEQDEELAIYLKEILKLESKEIDEILQEFHDNI